MTQTAETSAPSPAAPSPAAPSPAVAIPAAPSPGAPAGSGADLARIRYGALLIVAAFALLGVVFGVAVTRFTGAADVTAVVGSVAAVIGTIVGAFFGVQAGSSGKETAEAGRAQAENAARTALAMLEPEQAAKVLKAL